MKRTVVSDYKRIVNGDRFVAIRWKRMLFRILYCLTTVPKDTIILILVLLRIIPSDCLWLCQKNYVEWWKYPHDTLGFWITNRKL